MESLEEIYENAENRTVELIEKTNNSFNNLIFLLEGVVSLTDIQNAPTIIENISKISEQIENLKNEFNNFTKYYLSGSKKESTYWTAV